MRTALLCLFMGVIGFALSNGGISLKRWQFWVVILCYIGIIFTATYIG